MLQPPRTDTPAAAAPTSQLARFMALHMLEDYAQLCSKAEQDPQWFWRAVMEFHRLHFFHPFDQLLDVSEGPAWPRWCVGGTTNISYSIAIGINNITTSNTSQ